MSEEYLDLVSQTIEAKRGRNVEKYRVRYENATQMYEYINTYIYSLNNEQFRSNSENYSRLSAAFRNFEMVSVMLIHSHCGQRIYSSKAYRGDHQSVKGSGGNR